MSSVVHDRPVYNYLSYLFKKLKFWVGMTKQLLGQLLARYLIYLARENRCLAQFMLHLISALPYQINQMSDSSQPNNYIIFAFLKQVHSMITNRL